MTHLGEESEEEREERLQAALASLMTPTEQDLQRWRAAFGSKNVDELESLRRVAGAVPQLERLMHSWPIVGRSPVTDAVKASGRTWADFGLLEEDAASADKVFVRAHARARGEQLD